ncbi:hypothetical protein [Rhodoferax sp.]|uniref:hypothetical protein n=1 Tax=Rhodoferax sp. TaxID=50421 RepID=UPI002ACDD84C|nr:hypothetical protein [Rhodoferax sp.]MDZ7920242.1 hypothetical protein [Rhodoferax sp.]
MNKRFLSIALLAAFVSLPISVLAQEVKRTPLPKDHPLIGSWKIDLPQAQCFELYNIHQDGTMAGTSGAQAAESEFEISASPSSLGFYKWVDKITRDNGKPDCMGSIMEVGHVATNFIALHRAGKMFLLCEKEDLNTCIGPFNLQP